MQAPTPNIQSWPLGGIDENGQLDWAKDDTSIREVMLNILLTRQGERIQKPTFGAGLPDFVHQPNNETTRNLIAGVVRKNLALLEPRVVVDQVLVQPGGAERLSDVHINIRYRLKHRRDMAELGFTLNLGA
ncbi:MULTISPECIES: GPW/gp25 family protein [Marinobacter]|uniref:GPW/gp25 family protein n=1 Tax=Marinobacter xiaoshiensis TaxID=3073652 RepID=A0ABU2HI65_9GAMM|nr:MULTISPECIES: GPW/gp25 family protein [unclassified Marinobacter]MBK1874917.1 GPW/gp25 family protein [Marinobacter sp. 1-3A]MBK1888287.1 GPW/gp25 family protein [Marinobacter sp. DY40_1A1]MDS1310763.1 GPW/gp25 family protein [Marinobacter sp. F60267]